MMWIWLFAGLIISGNLVAQNTDMYLSLLQEGRIHEVLKNLPDLISKYPDDPGVLYLQALTLVDGDSSIARFHTLIKKFPGSKYADDAEMKIGEYLYARGLYSQASVQLRFLPINYPHSEHLQRAINLMVKSYEATGELDSLRHYLRIFKRTFPNFDFDQYGISGLDEEPDVVLGNGSEKEHEEKIDSSKEKKVNDQPVIEPPQKPVPRPWVVQVGAFGKYDNARRLRRNLSQNGYQVIMDEVMSNGRRLHVVRVARYSSRDEAIKVGLELKEKYGLDFRVLNKPEKSAKVAKIR